jgi:predicted ATPase
VVKVPKEAKIFKLRRFRITGFKSLVGLDIVFPGHLLFLIGPNGSGKTALLQALAFIQYFARGKSLEFFKDRNWNPMDIRSKISGSKLGSLDFEILLEDQTGLAVLWQFAWGLLSGLLIRERVWLRRSRAAEPELIFQYDRETGLKQDRRVLRGLKPEGTIFSLVEPREIAKEYGSIIESMIEWARGITSLELLSPSAMRQGARGITSDIGVRGERLASFLAALKPRQKERIVRRMARYYPIKHLDTTRKRAGWIDVKIAESYRILGSIRAVHMSDGFFRILALCAIPEFVETTSMILLDEAENGIEPHILPRLIKDIAKHSKGQLLLTSHSPLLVNFFEPIEICFLSRSKSGKTFAASLESLRIFDEGKEYFGVGDLWANIGIENITDEMAKIANNRDEVVPSRFEDRERVVTFMGTA